MKMTQNNLAMNKSKSGGSKTPKQPMPAAKGSCSKGMDQMKVADKGINCKGK